MEYREDPQMMSQTASGRARIYDLLARVFGRVTDSATIAWLQGPELGGLLDALGKGGDEAFQGPAGRITDYISGMATREQNQVIEELSVDRTMLVRAPGQSGFSSPYEGHYKNEKASGGSPLAVKSFYRKAGMLPDDSTAESPDFLCLELDFMRRLCLREAAQWSEENDPAQTIRLEHEFISEHLGSWVSEYCKQAAKAAQTDFYRGCLDLMAATVQGEREILSSLIEQLQ